MLVIGVIGADVHAVGNKILYHAFTEAGFEVVNLGVMVAQEEYIAAAIEVNADAIVVSSLYGQGIVDAAGMDVVSRLSGLPKEKIAERVKKLRANPDKIPNGDRELELLDYALACCATREAVSRHAGSISETYTMMGLTYVQEGKNLTKVKQIVVTGGSLIHTKRTEEIASYARFDPAQPGSLRPKDADVWVDRKYILAAMGLLSAYYPKTALRIMKKELEYYGHSEQANS